MGGTVTRTILLVAALACGPAVRAETPWAAYLGGNDRAGSTPAALPADLDLAWVYRSRTKPVKAWAGPRTEPIEGHVMLDRVVFDAAPQVTIADGRVYFGSTVDHRLHCLDAATGAPLWNVLTDGPIRLAPALAHGRVYVGSDDGQVSCLDARDGTLAWRHRVGPADDRLLARGEMISRWPVRTGVLVDGDVAYFGAGVFPHETVYLCAADAHTGAILWRNDRISQEDAGRNDLSPQGYLLAGADMLYVPSGRSLPVAFAKATGDLVFKKSYSWRTDAGGVVGGTKALLGDGQIYAGGPHHFLAMDQATGGIGAAYIGGRLMALAGDRAFLLDGTKVFCVDRAEHARASRTKQEWFIRSVEARSDPAKLAEAREKIAEYAGVGVLWEHPCELDGALIATAGHVVVGGRNRVLVLDRATGAKTFEAEVVGNVMGLAATESLLIASTDEGHLYGFATVPPGPDGATRAPPRQWPLPASDPFAGDERQEPFRRAAAEILRESGQRSGYCLVAGCGDGRLAYELAAQSDLQVYAVEPDAGRAAAARDALERAGLHASRVTVVEAPLDDLPFSNYFANLVVSETQFTTGTTPCAPRQLARFVKPCGGVVMLAARPPATGAVTPAAGAAAPATAAAWLDDLHRIELAGSAAFTAGRWHGVRRGQLPGAAAWTHQYGNAANTSFTPDRRVRGGLGVLWYGDPGPSAMINRHEAAGAPLATNGRMFIQGTDKVMAYDAYNGTFLWELENPGAIRTGVFNNRETHNLAATDDRLYMAIDDTCRALDAATGREAAVYRTPASPDGIARAWAYVAVDGGQLFGTSTIRQDLEARMRRRGLTVATQTDAIFAYDVAAAATPGEPQWIARGEEILHTTIALGPEHVFFVESSITPEERQALYRRDKGELAALVGEAAARAEAEMKALDVRRAVCLDRRTGARVWARPVDVTDTTNVSAGGGSLTVMVADGKLVLCGANANGHYWKQFLAGEFEKRKLLVLDAATGAELWSRNANYMNRPAVIEGVVYAEPWAFDLATGVPKTRQHPVTGEESPWRFSRPGHHCGVITATPEMMFFRSGFIGYYNLYEDSGTRHFAGQRLGCWVNAIPGNGLVMIPEASAGCVCQFSIASTVVLEPTAEMRSWGILSAVGATTPVQRLGINLGAPGDRTDDARREWFGFPRPKAVARLEFVFDIKPRLAAGGGWYADNPDSVAVRRGNLPWLHASGARGLERCEIPLVGAGEPPATYTVRLTYAGLTAAEVEALPVRLQATAWAGTTRTLASGEEGLLPLQVREFTHVPVERDLVFDCPAGDGALPRMTSIEVVREMPAAAGGSEAAPSVEARAPEAPAEGQ
jgi:outer membrane protein assembly factor BamB